VTGGRLIGVGVGPGDPELVTLKALRVLREAAVIFVPVGDGDGTPDGAALGRAEAVVLAHVDAAKVRRLTFTLAGDRAARAANWDRAGGEVARALRSGMTAAFATIGDPSIYSTFAYLAATVRGLLPEVAFETVPGITAMQDLACRSAVTLVEGGERLALLPLTTGTGPLAAALDAFDTVVCYKGGQHLPEILEALRAAGRLERAVFGARLGLDGEIVRPAAELLGRSGPYLSTVIALPERPARGSKLP
jgi:precorrin-2/cobalt-factor-2 C20-methyltransferase